MTRTPAHREPTHAGEVLLEEFLEPLGLSQRELAAGIRVPYRRVNELVNGRRGVTPSVALRLAKFFGTSPDFWMNLQQRWDLYHARAAEAQELRKIRRTSRVPVPDWHKKELDRRLDGPAERPDLTEDAFQARLRDTE